MKQIQNVNLDVTLTSTKLDARRLSRQPWAYIFIGREAETLWGTKYALEKTRIDVPETCLEDYGLTLDDIVKEKREHGYRLYAMEKGGQNE